VSTERKQIRSWKREERAFTLIELLVTISTISLLVATLMPSMAKVKEAARTTICLTNEKQQALAVMMYADDWNGYFPANYRIKGMVDNNTTVYDKLESYGPQNAAQDVKRPTGLWVCPSDKSAMGYPYTYYNDTRFTAFSSARQRHEYVSYGMNMSVEGGPYGLFEFMTAEPARKITGIERPANTLLFVDNSSIRSFTHFGCPVTPFHGNGSTVNIVACDGHAESLSVTDLIAVVPPIEDNYGATYYWRLPESWYRIDK